MISGAVFDSAHKNGNKKMATLKNGNKKNGNPAKIRT